MAETRYANVSYQGDGVQTKYSFPFDYLRKAFVKVQLVDGDNRQSLTQGTDYTVTGREINLSSPTTKIINIYRENTTEPIVNWNDASVLRADDMTLQEVQLLHLIEETYDAVFTSGMRLNLYGELDALNHKIVNVLPPVNDNDAATKKYVDDTKQAYIQRENNALKYSDISQKWAEYDYSPDNAEDTDSPTGLTMSSKSWAKYSKDNTIKSEQSATDSLSYSAMAKESEETALKYANNSEASSIEAEKSAQRAEKAEQSSSASPYEDTVIYNFPDIVVLPNGDMYRCTGENITGENPVNSNNWVKVMSVYGDFFDLDKFGNLMPAINPIYSNDFDLDEYGDIMPKD